MRGRYRIRGKARNRGLWFFGSPEALGSSNYPAVQPLDRRQKDAEPQRRLQLQAFLIKQRSSRGVA